MKKETRKGAHSCLIGREVYKEFQNVNRTSDKWMDNGGFNGSRHLESYPYSAALPGVEDSLEIAMFTSDEELDYKCTGVFQGYRVRIRTIFIPSSTRIFYC